VDVDRDAAAFEVFRPGALVGGHVVADDSVHVEQKADVALHPGAF
jgi:UDP-N-acetyl-D-mannosaminuronate dehydrogenase